MQEKLSAVAARLYRLAERLARSRAFRNHGTGGLG